MRERGGREVGRGNSMPTNTHVVHGAVLVRIAVVVATLDVLLKSLSVKGAVACRAHLERFGLPRPCGHNRVPVTCP